MHVKWLGKCIKWICDHLEIVNLDWEENKDNSEKLHVKQQFLHDDGVFSEQIILKP